MRSILLEMNWHANWQQISEIPPGPPEGVKKLEYSPSPYPLPSGERVNKLKYKKKCPPHRRGRDRVGVVMEFFHTFPFDEGGMGEIAGTC